MKEQRKYDLDSLSQEARRADQENVTNGNNSSNTACDAPFKDNNSNQQQKSNTMQLFDHFAAAALQALITKLPLQDRDGEFAEAKTEDEINEIKKDLCEASYNYAWHMMKAREYFEPYFKQFIVAMTEKVSLADLKKDPSKPAAQPAITEQQDSEAQWKQLRDKFFKECVEIEQYDQRGCLAEKYVISYAPHDLFEWFKRELAQPTQPLPAQGE